MKKILILASLLIGFSVAATAQSGKLKISWSFKNVVEGYAHNNKCVVYIDDEKIATSTERSEDKKNKMTINVPMGEHHIRIVNFAQYEGNWEEHTIANNYSIDCIVDEDHIFGKSNSLSLVFDIDSGTAVYWK